MISSNYNRFFQALLYLMLISAALHMIILGVHSILVFNILDFNFFKIIGLDIFYPDFVASAIAMKLSFVVIICIYVSAYFLVTKNQKKQL